jgi:hypothetical protein
VPGVCLCRASRHPKLLSSKNDMKHPTGLQLKTIDERYQMNPYPILNRARQVAPVHFTYRAQEQLRRYS